MSEPETKTNPNSALYWQPTTAEVTTEFDLLVPETEIVPFDFMDALPMLEGEPPKSFPWAGLESAAEEIGYPVFLRTDLSSAKHQGIDAIRADSREDLESVAAELVSDAGRKMMRPAAFLVREWVEIDAQFDAFDGLPIGVEFRSFATPQEHLETHYYWPEDSIQRASMGDEFWKPIREEMANARRPPWLESAARAAAFEADFQNGIDDPGRAWSVDFARDSVGQWWLIDMALAEDSWHPDGGLETDGGNE